MECVIFPLEAPLVGVESVLLPYTHFSVLMRPDKRLAAVTALVVFRSRLHGMSEVVCTRTRS